jgi:hypothetical protein
MFDKVSVHSVRAVCLYRVYSELYHVSRLEYYVGKE